MISISSWMRLVSVVVHVIAAVPAQYQYTGEAKQGIVMSWNVSPTDVTIELVAPVSGYVSVGWSQKGKMSESFAAVGIDQGGKTSLQEYIITSYEPQGVNVAGDQPLRNGSVITQKGVTTMTFTRPIQHASRPIPLNRDINMIWAVHQTTKVVVPHTRSGSFIVNLSTGAMTQPVPVLIITHGVMMLLAFTFALPMGSVWVRYRDKSDPRRILRHKQVQAAGGVLALIAFLLAVISVGDRTHFNSYHGIVGLVVMIVTGLQFGVAFLRPEFGSVWRPTWIRFHVWAGRLIAFVGPMQCALGVWLYLYVVGSGLQFMIGVILAGTMLIWGAAVAFESRPRLVRRPAQSAS